MGLFKESGTNPDLFIPQPRKRGLGNEMFRRPFTAWNVAIVTKDRLLRERYTKILMSGGADVKVMWCTFLFLGKSFFLMSILGVPSADNGESVRPDLGLLDARLCGPCRDGGDQ